MYKIAIVTPSISRTGGGVSEVARLQALALADDVDLTVHTLRSDFDEADLPSWGHIPVFFHKITFLRRYGFSLSLLWNILNRRVDLVHVHGVWQFPCLAVYIWSLISGKPYIVTPHGMLEPWILSRSRYLKKVVSVLYQDAFLRRSAAFQVLTEKESQDVKPYLKNSQAVEIPNYVLPRENFSTKPSWWIQWMDERDIYLFFGRVHEKKSCVELLDAWRFLSANDPKFHSRSVLVYCGWNDGVQGFERMVSEAFEQFGNVVFAGPQYGEDKYRSLDSATFFVLPSKSEGLPMSILEAWNSGLPVIMTDECNLPIGFESGAALRTTYTVDGIVDCVRSASKLNSAERKFMGDSGRQVVADLFSACRVRQALLDLYSSCLDPNNSR